MNTLFLVSFGGMFGALSRFFINQGIKKIVFLNFPLATLTVNVLGCLAAGFIYEFFKNHPQSTSIQYFLLVGYLGSFTTFSAFSLETIQLLKSEQLSMGLLSIFLNVSLCLGAILAGSLLSDFIKH